MAGKRLVVLFVMQVAAVLWFGSGAFAYPADTDIGTNTCGSPASSVSVADPFTTTFSVTVNAGDSVLSIAIGYRAAGKTVSSVVFNGSENLTKSAGQLGNTMGAEIW